jgi:RNA polymerase sigma-70 factor (ECF subfamily)
MDRTEDRQLISRLQAGDDSAVQELAERYTPRIFQLAMRHMKNREDAEEVTQDVLVKVYRKVGEFRGDSALSSWIYRITFNTAMSRLRNGRWPAPQKRNGNDWSLRRTPTIGRGCRVS